MCPTAEESSSKAVTPETFAESTTTSTAGVRAKVTNR
jgi:hypothetical protein